MSVKSRHHVTVRGSGKATLVFSHGFGCDQQMWRFVAPHFESRYRTVLFDLVGSGHSDLAAYRSGRYETLVGHAEDLIEVVEEFGVGPVVLIGHSVSGMIGALAYARAPSRFAAQVMIGPSPRYINDPAYEGGFTREDIDSLLDMLESNYLGWSSNMAPSLVGAPDRPELSDELAESFARTDPDIAKHFARVIFLSDHRDDVGKLLAPTLILQSSEDFIAPLGVGEYLQRAIPNSTLKIVDNTGHYPQLSAATACIDAIDEFLAELGV